MGFGAFILGNLLGFGFAFMLVGILVGQFCGQIGAFVGYPIAKGAMNPVKSTALAMFSTPEAVASLKYFWASGITAAVVCGLVALLMAHQQRNVGVQNQALGETAQNPAAH